MTDIDFIKWKVNYAEGFDWLEGNIGFQPCIRYKEQICIANLVTEWDLYPLLLQRARSGWNKAHKSITHFIDMNKEYIEFNCDIVNPPLYWYKNYLSEDEALEKTLKYIYEQETK